MAPSVLLAGLPWNDPSIPPHVGVQIKAGVEKTLEDLKVAGYDAQLVSASAADGVKIYTEELKKRKYDAVVVGFGVRGNPAFTEYFETLVNTVATVSPGTKFAFNSSPDSTLEALGRVVPL